MKQLESGYTIVEVLITIVACLWVAGVFFVAGTLAYILFKVALSL